MKHKQTKHTLTVKEIQQAIVGMYKEKGYKYFSINTFGMGEFEADMLAVHPTDMFCVEFEIKRSRSDFYADFNKKNKHELLKKGLWPSNQFYFVVERGLIDVQQIPYHLGLITIEKRPIYHEIKRGIVTKTRRTYEYDVAVERVAKVLHQNQFPQHMLMKVLTSIMHKFFENFVKNKVETLKNNERN